MMKKIFSALIFSCLTLQPLYAGKVRNKIAVYQHSCEKADALNCNKLGNIYERQGLYRKAETLYQRALQINEKKWGEEHPEVATSLNHLAQLYTLEGRYPQVEPLSLRALKIQKKTLAPEHLAIAVSLNILAEFYKTQGRYQEAEPLYQHALKIRETALGSEHLDMAVILNNLAGLYRNQGRYKQAEPLYLQALKIREKALGLEHPEVAQSLNGLAGLYYKQGLYSKAEAIHQQALKIREKTLGSEHPDIAQSLNNLAELYRLSGRYEQAEPFYQRALKIRKKALGLEHPDVAQSLNNLALFYVTQGLYDQAEPLYQSTLAIDEKVLGPEHPHVANSLNNLAGLYRAQGRYDLAEALYQRALKIREKSLGLDHPEVAQSVNNLARLYFKQGLYDQAESLYQRALAIREKAFGMEHPDVAQSLSYLAELYKTEKLYDQAEQLYQRALKIREKVLGLEHPDVAQNFNNLADLYKIQEQYSRAESLYQQALQIDEKALGAQHPYIATDLSNLAWLYQNMEQWDKAQQLWQRHLRLTNQFLERLLWGAGDKTRQAYIQQQEPYRNTYLTFYSFRNLPEEAFYFSLTRKGLLLRIASEVRGLVKNSDNPIIQQQLIKFNQLKSQLSTLVLQGNTDKDQLELLEEKINTLEMQLSQKVSHFKRNKTVVTPSDIFKKLKSDQVLVDFLVFTEIDLKTTAQKTEQLIALIVDNKRGVKLVKLGEMQPITEAIQTYRRHILPNTLGQLVDREEILKPISAALYQSLWQPLLPYLANKKQVYLIPDGILHLLPFKALLDEQGQYLAQTQQITLLSSARDIVLPALNVKTSQAAIFSAPSYNGKESKISSVATNPLATKKDRIHFYPLEGADKEGEFIRNLINTKQPVALYNAGQATEAALDKIKSPRFLHFATHGFFLEDKLVKKTSNSDLIRGTDLKAVESVENTLTHSGLALTGANLGMSGKTQTDGTDGILTALEVLALDLTGTEVVTLSACETGVGDIQVGEGVYSLTRAFQEAGAKAVLSTLWSIADDQTNVFMQNFYTLVLNGVSPQAALQQTQLKFISNKATQDPFFWAAFTVVGNN